VLDLTDNPTLRRIGRSPAEPEEDFTIKLLSLTQVVPSEFEHPSEIDQQDDKRPIFELATKTSTDPVVAEFETGMRTSVSYLHICVTLPF
jgi:hypothetical protein